MDLSQYNFYLMPISFFTESSLAEGLVLNKEEKRFLDFIDIKEKETSDTSPYEVTINVNIRFVRSKTSDAIKVQLGREEGATKIHLSEDQIREKYPWDYDELKERMKERYRDFKIDKKFHELRKAVLGEEKFAKRRYLDPAKPQSGKKDFYNPNILQYFDTHYTRY